MNACCFQKTTIFVTVVAEVMSIITQIKRFTNVNKNESRKGQDAANNSMDARRNSYFVIASSVTLKLVAGGFARVISAVGRFLSAENYALNKL